MNFGGMNFGGLGNLGGFGGMMGGAIDPNAPLPDT